MPHLIDTKRLIAFLGGRSECHRLLVAAGHPISKKAIEKWSERGSIPLTRLLQLQEADYKFNKRGFALEDFFNN